MQGRTRAAGVLCALLLAGCGSGDELLTIDRVGQADAPKTLKLQINASYSPQASDAVCRRGLPQALSRLGAQAPRVAAGPQHRRLEHDHVRAGAAAGAAPAWGTAPDCANVDSFTVPLFIEQGVLKPLDEHFTKAQLDDLFPNVRKVMTGPDGHIYAWWWSTDLRVIYRNTELVPEPPKTWDELIEYAKAAEKQDPKVDGYLFNGGRWEATTFDNLGYFWMQGGKLLGDNGEPVFAQGANREAMLNVFKFLRRTIDEGVTPSRVTTFQTYDEMATAAQGKSVAMFLGGSFQWPTMKEQLGKEFDKWEVSEIPGPQARQDRDRHRRLGDGRVQRRP